MFSLGEATALIVQSLPGAQHHIDKAECCETASSE
jgi:hypothetical protein